MWQDLKKIWGLGWLIFFSQLASAQPIEVFEDPTGSITLEQILSEPDRFEPTAQKSFGFSESTFWLRIRLSNPASTNTEQIIQLEAVHAPSEILAYRPTADGIETLRSGANVPIAKRPNDDRMINFPFMLAPNSQDTVYLKIQDRFQIHLGHRVIPASLAQVHNERALLFSTAVTSALLALLSYNLAIAVFSRSRLYANYSVLLASSLFIFIIDSRQAELVGWLTNRAFAYPTTALFFAASFLFLGELFKEVDSRLTRLNRGCALVLSIVHLLLPIDLMIRAMDHYLTPLLLLMLAVEIAHAVVKRHPLAPFTALGWTLYVATIFVSIQASQGKVSPIWANLYALGSVLEALFFSIALAVRLRKQDQKNLDLIDDLNESLVTDRLTRLLNRNGIYDWLTQNSTQNLGLVLLNIDRFKSVNEMFSTQVADRLLAEIAANLKKLVPEKGQIGRLGADEFLIAMPFVSEEQLDRSAQQLVTAVNRTRIDHAGQDIVRTASAGSVRLDSGHSLTQALTEVDLALISSKQDGGDKYTHFSPEFEAKMYRRGAFITDVEIENALRASEFKYFVQPIVRTDLRGTTVEGFEALIRWVKPSGELILPGAFAQKFDAVFFKSEHRSTRQSMRQAVFDAAKSFGSVYVSWNFSADQLGQSAFVDNLIHEFNALDTGSIQVVIELSEHRAKANFETSNLIEQLKRLRAEGFQVALDDFGVEHSNIDRLTSLPLDIVKLDRSLIEKHRDSTQTNFVIRSIVVLCRSLKLKIIAEGIETENDSRRLRACNVESQQGFWQARPMDPVDLSSVSGEPGGPRNLNLV